MERVNARYEARFEEPRRLDIRHSAVMRIQGRADIETTATVIGFQLGEKGRLETVDNTHSGAAPRAGELQRTTGPGFVRQVIVIDGEETKIRTDFLPGETGRSPVMGQVIRHDQLPEGFRTSPLTNEEFDEVFLEAPFRADGDVLDGRPVYVLTSTAPFQVNADTTMLLARFWIDVEDLTILRVETSIRQETEEIPLPVYVSSTQQVETTFGVQVDPSIFRLELPEDAVDLTPRATAVLTRSKKP